MHMRILRGSVLVGAAAMMVLSAIPAGSATSTPSSNGHGGITLTNTNGDSVKRQFSFSAVTKKDGTVTGTAELRNPSFDPVYRVQIDVSCLKVTGNVASFGGTVKHTTDPVFNNEFSQAFWTVVDNGEPGKNDTISEMFFDNVVPPSSCQFITPTDFPQIPIENGNVQVKS